MKNKENYLDYIPKRNEEIDWIEKENGLIQIIIYRNSFLDKVIRKLFFTPETYKIDLDELGSFVWENIDGKKTIYEISLLIKEEFGKDAEPLYDRLIEYIKILKNNKFISFL